MGAVELRSVDGSGPRKWNLETGVYLRQGYLGWASPPWPTIVPVGAACGYQSSKAL
jgi:hypothetical protein